MFKPQFRNFNWPQTEPFAIKYAKQEIYNNWLHIKSNWWLPYHIAWSSFQFRKRNVLTTTVYRSPFNFFATVQRDSWTLFGFSWLLPVILTIHCTTNVLLIYKDRGNSKKKTVNQMVDYISVFSWGYSYPMLVASI